MGTVENPENPFGYGKSSAEVTCGQSLEDAWISFSRSQGGGNGGKNWRRFVENFGGFPRVQQENLWKIVV